MGKLCVISMDHNSSSVGERHEFAYRVSSLGAFTDSEDVLEYMRLETCNRAELYLVLSGEGECEILNELPSGARTFYDYDAVRHLLRVLLGLESMAKGEAHIVSQVKAAYGSSDGCGKVLHRLFQRALGIAASLRSCHPGREPSLSRIAAEHYLRDAVPDRPVMVAGMGAIGRETAHALLLKGCEVLVSNRTPRPSDEKLSRAKVVPWESWREQARECGAVFLCTSSPVPILSGQNEDAMPDVRVFDLGAPHQSEPRRYGIRVTLDEMREIADELLDDYGNSLTELEMETDRASSALLAEIAMRAAHCAKKDIGPFRLISSINLDKHEILVVGGGLVALRKIDTLLGCGARVRVVALEAAGALERLASEGRVILEKREACENDFASHRFAVLAVPRDASPGLERIARAARCAIDICAGGSEGDFALCAQFEMDGCFAGVSSGGFDPARAASVKQSILKTFREPISVLTRKSQLATSQTALWTDTLEAAGFRTSVRTVESYGDRDRQSELSSFGFGAFVKALEDELLNGRGDCAVHSMKDVPTIPVEGCSLAAVLKRDSVRDVLVTRDGCDLESLPDGAVIGTSSVRRRAQIRYLRPDLVCVNCRGNIGTRLEKLFAGKVDALVLAEVGIKRIGAPVCAEVLPFITCAGQGAVVAEALAGSVIERILRLMNHLPTWYEVTAERAFLSRLASGCVCPVGVNAFYESGQMEITAEVYPERGSPERAAARGAVDSAEDAAALADELWETMCDGPVVREIRKAVAS